MLQHIHQAFVIGRARFVVRPPEMGKHARHRCRRAGAARPGVALAGDVFFRQFGRGRAAVAIDREIDAAAGFAQHQQQQRRLDLACIAGAEPRVFAQGKNGRLVALKRPGCHRTQRIEGIERVDQVAHLGIVAHHRGDALKEQHQHHDQQGATRQQCGQVGHGLARRVLQPDVLAPQQHAGQHRQHQHGGQQAPVEQVARLARIGLQGVDDHGLVDDNAVRHHEISAKSRRHAKKHDDRLERPAPGQQADQSGRGQANDQRQGKADGDRLAAAQVGQPGQRAPQRHVADRGDPEAGEHDHPEWAHAGHRRCCIQDKGTRRKRGEWFGRIRQVQRHSAAL